MTPNRSWGRKKTPKKKSGIVPAKVSSLDPAFRVQFRLEMWKVARMEADALHFCLRRVFEKVCAFPSLDEYHTLICVVCIQTGYFFINQWYCIEIDSRKGLHGCEPRHGLEHFLRSSNCLKIESEEEHTRLLQLSPRASFPTFLSSQEKIGHVELEFSMTHVPPTFKLYSKWFCIGHDFEPRYCAIPAVTVKCQTRKRDFFRRQLRRKRDAMTTSYLQIIHEHSSFACVALPRDENRRSFRVFCGNFFFRFSFGHVRYHQISTRHDHVAAFAEIVSKS